MDFFCVCVCCASSITYQGQKRKVSEVRTGNKGIRKKNSRKPSQIVIKSKWKLQIHSYSRKYLDITIQFDCSPKKMQIETKTKLKPTFF